MYLIIRMETSFVSFELLTFTKTKKWKCDLPHCGSFRVTVHDAPLFLVAISPAQYRFLSVSIASSPSSFRVLIAPLSSQESMISLTLPEGQIENIERVHERAKGREGNGDPRV